jgi:hypothetical protein
MGLAVIRHRATLARNVGHARAARRRTWRCTIAI